MATPSSTSKAFALPESESVPHFDGDEPVVWAAAMRRIIATYDAAVMATPVRNRSEVLGRLADLAPHLLALGVTSLRVFGSAGRDVLTDESDVDILVEFDRPMGAFEFLDLRDDLARTLGRPVDLVTPAAVKERMWARIEREAVDAV